MPIKSFRASKMVQLVNILSIKPNAMSSNSKKHIVEKHTDPLQIILESLCTCDHTHSNVKNSGLERWLRS